MEAGVVKTNNNRMKAKNLIHAELIGAANERIIVICDCRYDSLRQYLDEKGYADFKIIDWKYQKTVILV